MTVSDRHMTGIYHAYKHFWGFQMFQYSSAGCAGQKRRRRCLLSVLPRNGPGRALGSELEGCVQVGWGASESGIDPGVPSRREPLCLTRAGFEPGASEARVWEGSECGSMPTGDGLQGTRRLSCRRRAGFEPGASASEVSEGWIVLPSESEVRSGGVGGIRVRLGADTDGPA